MMDDPLGRLLSEREFLKADDCRVMLEEAESEGCFLEEILIREQTFTREFLLKLLENEYFCPAVDLPAASLDAAPLSLIPRRLAARHLAFPLRVDDQGVVVAFGNPDNDKAREAVSLIANRPVVVAVALRHEIRDMIEERYREIERIAAAEAEEKQDEETAEQAAEPERRSSRVELDFLPATNEDASATELVDKVIDEAADRGATDIHIEPKERHLVVRYRLDGVLVKVANLPRDLAPAVVSRVKILGGMDIAERRLPQDGRHTIKKGLKLFDLRISSAPAQFGEKVVIRLLSKVAGLLDLANVGMPSAVRKRYQEFIDSPQGMYLVCGPTGSGKTTTLYATLNALDCESINVLTLEDPIEYTLPEITQVQVREDIDLTFSNGLRSFLRQDPDVILIGEIRDADTVEIACRAALTGHKVFSTIHTNDAAQAIPRLSDMGIPPYMIAATLRGVLSQRLVRMICHDCKEEYNPSSAERAILGYPKVDRLHRGRGCEACVGTGYRNRTAIFEYLSMFENIHRLIFERASSFAIRHAARQNDMIPMGEFARMAALNGTTTVPEIQRAVLSDEGREQICRHCGQVVSMDFSVCPFCQHVLKEKCADCEHPLDPTWLACPKCGKEVESELRKTYCPHCQAPLTSNWDSCPFCGGGLR